MPNNWSIRLKTAATTDPVSQAELESQCRVVAGQDTTLLVRAGKAATAHVEKTIRRSIINATYQMWFNRWPVNGGRLPLLRGRLQSVSSIKWTDVNAVQTTLLSGTDYLLDDKTEPGEIVLPFGASWPSGQLSPVNPIEVEFVAGYGATSASVPEDLRHMILMLAGELYNYREALIIGVSAAGLASALAAARITTWTSMLNLYKLPFLGDGDTWQTSDSDWSMVA